MSNEVESGLKSYKKEATEAAYDLFYGSKVIKEIEEATTIGQIDRIMRTARHEKFGRGGSRR